MSDVLMLHVQLQAKVDIAMKLEKGEPFDEMNAPQEI
jgi:hypothetical protein